MRAQDDACGRGLFLIQDHRSFRQSRPANEREPRLGTILPEVDDNLVTADDGRTVSTAYGRLRWATLTCELARLKRLRHAPADLTSLERVSACHLLRS